jgi:hypothetical protein
MYAIFSELTRKFKTHPNRPVRDKERKKERKKEEGKKGIRIMSEYYSCS